MKKIEACLICKEPLEYLNHAVEMECAFCHGKFPSNARCIHGHYICDECHAKQGIQVIREVCLNSDSKNPIALAQEIMKNPYIHMHGPEHHILVGAVLLTTVKNTRTNVDLVKNLDLSAALDEIISRGKQVPGGICGLWGSCGAGVSTGIFLSILTECSPLSKESWGMVNEMTSKSLHSIGSHGGPRCCKRDSFLAILEAVSSLKELFSIELELPEKVVCTFSSGNGQCLGKKCPFNQSTPLIFSPKLP